MMVELLAGALVEIILVMKLQLKIIMTEVHQVEESLLLQFHLKTSNGNWDDHANDFFKKEINGKC